MLRFRLPAWKECIDRVALPVRAPGIIIALTDVMALSLKDERASMF